MPRAASPESESEAERIPSKKQKKREKSPADDPMDEDGAEEEDEIEYEIEKVLRSSMDIFGVCTVFLSWPRRSGLNALTGRNGVLREMERVWRR